MSALLRLCPLLFAVCLASAASPGDGLEHTSPEEPVPAPGSDFSIDLDADVTLAMVWIPPGEFTMGSPPTEAERWPDEEPPTPVSFPAGFWMAKTPVTQAQWAAVMDEPFWRLRARAEIYWRTLVEDGGLTIDGRVVFSAAECGRIAALIASDPEAYGKGDPFPVYYVSWEEAAEFCRRLTEHERKAGRLPEGHSYALPSEAQWEYAVRAGTTGRWSFGDEVIDLEVYAWFRDNSRGRAHPVGEKWGNPWGLYDVHGNVWEWTRGWFGEYPGEPVADYDGPPAGIYRVLRGGAWNSEPRILRSAVRLRRPPGHRVFHVGFRPVLTVR